MNIKYIHDSEAKNTFLQTFVPKLKLIMEAVNSAEAKIQGYLTETRTRPDVSNELLTILYLSDELIEILNPTKLGGEYYGLPKDAVYGAKYPKKIVTNDGIDFTSWFAEKTTDLKMGAKDTVKYWFKDPDTLKLTDDAPFTAEEYIIDMLETGLFIVKKNAKAIYDMIVGDLY